MLLVVMSPLLYCVAALLYRWGAYSSERQVLYSYAVWKHVMKARSTLPTVCCVLFSIYLNCRFSLIRCALTLRVAVYVNCTRCCVRQLYALFVQEVTARATGLPPKEGQQSTSS